MASLPRTHYGSLTLVGEWRRETDKPRTSWAKLAVLITAVTAVAGMAGVSFAAAMSNTADVADLATPSLALRGAATEASRGFRELRGMLNARPQPTAQPISFQPLPRQEESGAVDEDDDEDDVAVDLKGTPSFAKKQPPLPAAWTATNVTAATAIAATSTATATAAEAGAPQPPLPTTGHVPQDDKTMVSPQEAADKRRLSEASATVDSTTTQAPSNGILNWPWSITGRRPPRRAAPPAT